MRRIFEGQVEFDAFEKTKITELNAYIEKKKFVPIPWYNFYLMITFIGLTHLTLFMLLTGGMMLGNCGFFKQQVSNLIKLFRQ